MRLLHRALRRLARLARPGRLFVLFCAVLALPAGAGDIVVREVAGQAWSDVRLALEDAIAEEGLAAPTVSRFGDMLARTAGDLGHRPDLYEHAEILAFCSVRAAAALAAEDPRHIALCPLTIAVYSLPAQTGRVFLAYRPTGVDSPAARLADETLARIVERTLGRLAGR